jgi:peroxiredoxin
MKTTSVSYDSSTLIPEFSLPSTRGGVYLGPKDFRQQSNMVIFFFHDWPCDHCRHLLRTLKEHADLFDWLDTRVLAIARSPLSALAPEAAELGPEITLLADQDGSVAQTYMGASGDISLPFLVIADRYGAFFSRMELEPGEEIDFGELESTLLFIATQCPECGRPTDEPPAGMGAGGKRG